MAGKDIKIGFINTALPNMSNTLNGWEVSVIADYVYQERNVDGEITDLSKEMRIKGVLQPLKAEEVQLKPEGQRSWAWYQLHVKSNYEPLYTEQVVKINNQGYKVMAVKNYDLYGYIEYHLIKDYE